MKKKNTSSNFKEEEKEILSKFFGAKLALFLADLDLSEDAKGLLMEILPNLSGEELVGFVNILEEKYASEETELLDIELENELAKIAMKYGDDQRKINEETIEKMDNLLN
jgi:hypothetical protein